MHRSTAFQRGFTLVEVSIVLAVLGLLVGTVIGAREMSKNQANREIASDAREYRIAFEQFKMKYAYYPGDFPLATEVWGTTPAGCPNGAGDGKMTCNGDGNGILRGFCPMPICLETTRAWQHLGNSELVAGQYTGVRYAVGGGVFILAGVNAPKSSIDKAVFMFGSMTGRTLIVDNSDTYYFAGDYTNALHFGIAGHNVGAVRPAVSVETAIEMDTKYDDGLATTGNIAVTKPDVLFTTDCTNTSNADAVYDTSKTGTVCTLVFKNTYSVAPSR